MQKITESYKTNFHSFFGNCVYTANNDVSIYPCMKYSGMTVNERLWVSGRFYDFENAVKERNIKLAVEILESVEITDDASKKAILESFGFEWGNDDSKNSDIK